MHEKLFGKQFLLLGPMSLQWPWYGTLYTLLVLTQTNYAILHFYLCIPRFIPACEITATWQQKSLTAEQGKISFNSGRKADQKTKPTEEPFSMSTSLLHSYSFTTSI